MRIQILEFIFILFLIFLSCKSRNEPVDRIEQWKYSEGYHVGDVLDFKDSVYSLHSDTIYKDEIPVAVVEKMENRPLSSHKVLYIRALSSDESGRYVGQ